MEVVFNTQDNTEVLFYFHKSFTQMNLSDRVSLKLYVVDQSILTYTVVFYFHYIIQSVYNNVVSCVTGYTVPIFVFVSI